MNRELTTEEKLIREVAEQKNPYDKKLSSRHLFSEGFILGYDYAINVCDFADKVLKTPIDSEVTLPSDEPIIIKLKKDDLNDFYYYQASNMYDFCKNHKIKIEEPRDSKTGLFETFIITLETPKDKILFSGKYIDCLKKVASKMESQVQIQRRER
jgi:hypothetical protein